MENLIEPVYVLLRWDDPGFLTPENVKGYYIFLGISSFFQNINPYFIAFFITFIIRYFAKI